jgi:two-component system cell cycle sensor histidine kinase/response regulator CckA
LITVESEPAKGCTFRILLPAAGEISAAVDLISKPSEDAFRGGTETILLADDNDGIREMMHTALSRLGYHVLQVADGQEAVRVFQDRAHAISLAILDVMMPKMGGCEAADRIHIIRPALPVVFTMGFSADGSMVARMVELGGIVLHKPYSPNKLAQRVRELLDRETAQNPVLPAAVPSHALLKHPRP